MRWIVALSLLAGLADADERGVATVTRNIFCSTCGRAPPETAVDLELVATMVVARDESWSLALVRERESGRPWLVRRGSALPGGALVTRVVDRRVWLTRGGRAEAIDLAVEANEPPAAPRSREIRCDGDRCEIDRALVERLLRDPSQVAGDALFAPAPRDGRPWGFRVNAVRPSSVFAQIGLRSGDVVTAINGQPTATPDQLLALWTRLRSASRLAVRIDRRGAALTLDYTIR